MSLRLPLFPLAVVLFPGASLPLHIFEPRYRRMLADCQTGDGRFGMLPADPVSEAPPVGSVGCVAELRAVQPLAGGRANILVAGARRFLLDRYLDEATPYLVGAATEFDDTPDPVDAETVERLRSAYLAFAALRGEVTDPEADAPPSDPGSLSFHVAAALDLETAQAQRLLELRSAAARIARLLELMPAASAAAVRAARVRHRARGNGTGAHRPDVAANG
jgi:Lon protease-like protein